MKTKIQQLKEKAVRDICSVSVAPASKSKVRQIIDELEKAVREELIEEIVKMCEGIEKEIIDHYFCIAPRQRNPKVLEGLIKKYLTDLIQKLKALTHNK